GVVHLPAGLGEPGGIPRQTPAVSRGPGCDHCRDQGRLMTAPQLRSLVVENQDSPGGRDAAAVLNPDTFVVGAPFDALARLRANAPVQPVQLQGMPRAWLLTKHADVRLVSRDTDTFTSSKGNTLVEVEAGPTSAMLPGIDPPRHVHFRKLINQGFTVRNVQRLEPRMREVARDIV